jgi:hypothetical protein
MGHVQQPVDLPPGQNLRELAGRAADMQRLAVQMLREEAFGRDGGEQGGEAVDHLERIAQKPSGLHPCRRAALAATRPKGQLPARRTSA